MIDLYKARHSKSEHLSRIIHTSKDANILESFMQNVYEDITPEEYHILYKIFSLDITDRHWNILTELVYDESIDFVESKKLKIITPDDIIDKHEYSYEQRLYFKLHSLINMGIFEEYSDNFIIMSMDTYNNQQTINKLIKL